MKASMQCYKLIDKKPVPITVEETAEVFAKGDRIVAKTHIAGVNISTVFLVIDHSYGGVKPILFETLVFGGNKDGELNRYATWGEAEDGHKVMVELVKANLTDEEKALLKDTNDAEVLMEF